MNTAACIDTERESSPGLPPAERFAHWQRHVAAVYEAACTVGAGALPAIESHHWPVDGMLVVSGRYPALAMRRSARQVHADPLDLYAIALRPAGELRIEVEGAGAVASAMVPVIFDMSRPFRMQWDEGPSITVYLPHEALDALLPRALDLHGVQLQGVGARLLAQHLTALEAQLPSMAAASAPAARQATLHLLAASLAPSLASLGLARPALECGNLHRLVRRHIEAQLGDIQLCTEKLCQHFCVSRSTLYRIFEPMGGVSSYIRSRRLARVHAILARPERRQYIGRLAEEFGFRSAAHFSRAFAAQFGYSPREVPLHAPEHAAGVPGARSHREALDLRAWLAALEAA